ncbi:hypothetical protein ACN38_g6600 [Penicillium nordicum]|uniref:Uncharacterized protein n=1 Tax=Penicillium nordicum TaxID=229535 RepID=A0A0M9WFA8_9EURO|nr:hypothetical protein ACN38_g6600 [Penicillium nordicum]
MQSHGPLPRVASPALNPGIPNRRKIQWVSCIDDHISDFSPRSLLDLYSAFTQASTSPSFCTVAVMPHYDLHWFDMPCPQGPPCPGRYQPLYPDRDHPWTNVPVVPLVPLASSLCGRHGLARSYVGSQPTI